MKTRYTKTLIALAAASLFTAGSAFAGNGPGSGNCDGSGDGTCDGTGGTKMQQQQRGGPADRMAGMANRLGLSDEQQVQALELFQKHEQERAAIHEAIFNTFGVEICDQRALHRAEFEELLTEEQLALHAEMAQRRGNRGGKGFGGFECPVDEG